MLQGYILAMSLIIYCIFLQFDASDTALILLFMFGFAVAIWFEITLLMAALCLIPIYRLREYYPKERNYAFVAIALVTIFYAGFISANPKGDIYGLLFGAPILCVIANS